MSENLKSCFDEAGNKHSIYPMVEIDKFYRTEV